MAYKYTVYTTDRRIVRGTIDAASEAMAEEALYGAGYSRVLTLREIRARGVTLEKALPTFFGVKPQHVIDFSRQLATLIECGIPIVTALQLLKGQASSTTLKKVIAGLVDDLQGGATLSQALGKYPQAFSHTYCQVIRASEHAGNLEIGLRRVGAHMEKRLAMKNKIGRAMVYPALVSIVAIGVFAILVTVALPPLVGLFTSLGAQLPWMTRLLIAVAQFLITYKLYLVVAISLVVLLIAGYVRSSSGKETADRLMLRLPLIGAINVERYMCQFCQTTSMMLEAGLQLPQTLDIGMETLGNRTVRQALKEVREGLVQGQRLSQSMATNGLFPRLLVEMVSVGEKTGTLDSALATVADYYERRVDQKIDMLIPMIEPLLTAAIGLVVLFIALSMITPLYSILSSMR